MPECDRPILIGCAPSSGSTLLSVILDAHPDVMCGPELSLFSHPFFWSGSGAEWRERLVYFLSVCGDGWGEGEYASPLWVMDNGIVPYVKIVYKNNLNWYGSNIESLISLARRSDGPKNLVSEFFESGLKTQGKRIWAEKSPTNIYGIPSFLDQYPNGKAVIMARDGRDTTLSLMKRGYHFEAATAIWTLEAAITLALSKNPRVHLLKYEDLVSQPRKTLEKLVKFLEISPAIDTMLDYQKASKRVAQDASLKDVKTWKSNPTESITSAQVAAWRSQMTAEQIALFYKCRLDKDISKIGRFVPGFDDLAGMAAKDLLKALGYSHSEVSETTVSSVVKYMVLGKIGSPLDESHNEYIKRLSNRNYKFITAQFHRKYTFLDLKDIFANLASQDITSIFADLEKEITSAYKIMLDTRDALQSKYIKISCDYEEIKNRHHAKSHELSSMRRKRDILGKQIKRIDVKYREMRARYNAMAQELEKSLREKQAMSADLGKLQSERQSLSQSLSTATQSLNAERASSAALKSNLDDMTSRYYSAAQTNTFITQKRDTLARLLSESAAKYEEISSRHETLAKDLGAVVKERDRVITERDALTKDLGAVVKERDRVITERDALTKDHGAVVKERDRVITERDALTKDHDAVVRERDLRIKDVAALQADNAQLKSRIDALTRETAELKDGNYRLSQSYAALRRKRDNLHGMFKAALQREKNGLIFKIKRAAKRLKKYLTRLTS